MVRTGIKVVTLDAFLLIITYFVGTDIQNRIDCALGSPLYGEGCLARSSPAFSYSVLTRFFSMVKDGMVLTSPPTLDWVQLVLLVFAVVNVWFVYTVFRERRPSSPDSGPPATAAT